MSTKNSPHTSAPSPDHDPFQAIADPTRRKMLRLLADREMSIAGIADQFPISRTAITKHLQVLADAGLVSHRRVGRESRYQAQPLPLRAVQQWLLFFEPYWDERLQALKRFVEGPEEPRQD